MNQTDPIHQPATPAAPASRGFRRGILRLLILLLIVSLALTVAAISGRRLLHSSYAHHWVIAAIETRTGLRISAGSIHINWLGKTTLQNVSASLPLGHRPILYVRTLSLRHNNVLWFSVTGHLGLSAISLTAPQFIIRRAGQGGWTPALVFAAVRQAWMQWKLTHPNAQPLSAMSFPRLHLVDGQVTAPAYGGKILKISHLGLTARPHGALAWHFHLSTPVRAGRPCVTIRGTLVPRQQWMHTLQVRGTGLQQWLRLFWPQWRGPAGLEANLVGHVTGATLAEHASHILLSMGALTVRGRTNIEYSGQRWQVNPRSLNFLLAWWPHPIRVFRGTLWADSRGVHGTAIRAQAAGGDLHLSGLFNPALGQAEIQAAWRNISLPGGDAQNGTITASLLSPWPGKRVMTARLTSSGQSAYGYWTSQLAIGAQGSLHHGFSWQLTAPKFRWNHGSVVQLDGLTARGSADQNHIAIMACTLPTDPYLKLVGRYALVPGVWHLRLACHGNSIPLAGLPADSTVNLHAYGNSGGMQIQNLLVANKTWSLAASGNCIFVKQYPAHLLLTVTGLPVVSHVSGRAAPWAIGGVMNGHLLAHGNLLPLNLQLNGRLAGAQLRINSHQLAMPAVVVEGAISNSAIHIATQPVKLLGGNVTVAGNARLNGQLASMTIAAQNIQAKQLAVMLLPPIKGTVAGRVGLKLTIHLPDRNLARANVFGSLKVTHLLWPALWPGTLPIHITAADTQIVYRRGRLSLAPIVVRSANGGNIKGTVLWKRTDPRHVTVALALARWPLTVQSQALTFTLNGSTTGSLNPFTRSYRGDATLTAGIRKLIFPIGSVKLRLHGLGRTLEVSNLQAVIMGNTLAGHAVYNMDRPLASSASLTCNLSNIPILLPSVRALHALRGGFHGTLSAGPSRGAHPLAPMEALLNLTPDNAHLGAMNLGPIVLHAFVSTHSVVVNHSSISLAGGLLRPWARLAKHSGGAYSAQLNLHFSDIDLGQITRTVKPRALPVPGLLSGRMTVIATPGRWNAAFGQGSLRIRHSDLINTTIIAALYNLLHVGTGSVAPTGHGHATWRLENGDAHITSLHYTDRGASTLATGTITNIWNMPKSAIAGYVVGTVQPFGNIHIPFVPQTKAILDALESNVSTIQVGGTWQNPTATPVAFKQLNDAIHETFIRAIVGRQHSTQSP